MGAHAAEVRRPWHVRLRALVRTVVDESLDDRLPGLAAEIAFFAVLSLFPGLLIATSLLGVLDVLLGEDVAEQARERVTGAMEQVLTDQASGAVASVEALFEGGHGGLVTFATLGAVFSLSGGFAVTVGALNLAYDTQEQRTWVRRRLLGLVLGLATVVLLVLLLTVLVIGPLLGRGDELADLIGLDRVFVVAWDLLRVPLMFLALVAWATALYHFAPNRESRWRDGLPGAALAAVLWVLATVGFSVYLRLAGDRNPVLGAFGGGIIVMLWAYLLSLALLAGGELNAVLLDRRHERRVEEDRPASGRS